MVLDRIEHSKRQDGGVDFLTYCKGNPACTIPRPAESPASHLPTEESAPANTPVPSGWEVEPVDPPGKLQCEPVPEKYFDSHQKYLEMAAEYFCLEHAHFQDRDPEYMPIAKTILATGIHIGFGEVIDNVREFKKIHKVRPDDVYDISIELVKDCRRDDPTLNLLKPLPGYHCVDILISAWKQCNNKGRGGSMVAGCLIYRIATVY